MPKTLADLKDLAKSMGIKGYYKMKKDQLNKAIKEINHKKKSDIIKYELTQNRFFTKNFIRKCLEQPHTQIEADIDLTDMPPLAT